MAERTCNLPSDSHVTTIRGGQRQSSLRFKKVHTRFVSNSRPASNMISAARRVMLRLMQSRKRIARLSHQRGTLSSEPCVTSHAKNETPCMEVAGRGLGEQQGEQLVCYQQCNDQTSFLLPGSRLSGGVTICSEVVGAEERTDRHEAWRYRCGVLTTHTVLCTVRVPHPAITTNNQTYSHRQIWTLLQPKPFPTSQSRAGGLTVITSPPSPDPFAIRTPIIAQPSPPSPARICSGAKNLRSSPRKTPGIGLAHPSASSTSSHIATSTPSPPILEPALDRELGSS